MIYYCGFDFYSLMMSDVHLFTCTQTFFKISHFMLDSLVEEWVGSDYQLFCFMNFKLCYNMI